MARGIVVFVVGLIVGMVLMSIIMWTTMPRMMLTVHRSKLGFEETVAVVHDGALERGWVVPKIYDIQQSLVDAGYEDMTKVKILSICQPGPAYMILKDDADKRVSAIMPCRIGIYEAGDGQVYVSEMNIGLMGKMFGGTIAQVMGKVAADEKEMLDAIIVD